MQKKFLLFLVFTIFIVLAFLFRLVPQTYTQFTSTTLELVNPLISFIRQELNLARPNPCAVDVKNSILVPKQAPTIQQAVDQLQLGTKGQVLVFPGTYVENVRIPEGKKVVIRGLFGDKKTKLRALQQDEPAMSIAAGGEACIIGLSINGGSAGIEAGEIKFVEQVKNTAIKSTEIKNIPLKPRPHLVRPAKLVAVQDTSISAAKRGLLLFADNLEVRGGQTTRNFGWGAVAIGQRIRFTNFNASVNLGGGLAVSSGLLGGICGITSEISVTSEAVFDDVSVLSNDGPGITICGANVLIEGPSDIGFNQGFGVLTIDSSDTVITDGTAVALNEPFTDGTYGDGIYAVDSNLEVRDGPFASFNARAGIIYNSAGGLVRDMSVMGNQFGIALECGGDPVIQDDVYFALNEVDDVTVGLCLEPPPVVEP